MKSTLKQVGLSIVELVVTLFVAATFLAAGYLLYSSIVQDGGATRQRAQASNIAYDYLRRYAATVSSPCAARTPLNNVPPADPITGLANVHITVQITCPQPASLPEVSSVRVTLRYGGEPQQEVYHAIFATQ